MDKGLPITGRLTPIVVTVLLWLPVFYLFPFLLLIFSLIGFAVALLFALAFCIHGAYAKAVKVVVGTLIYAVCYLSVLTLPLLRSPEILQLQQPYCFDRGCLSVERVSKIAGVSGPSYEVTVRVLSTLMQTSPPDFLGNPMVYLVDERGRRFSPVNDSAKAALDLTLSPGESAIRTLLLNPPADVHQLFFTGRPQGPFQREPVRFQIQ